MRKKVALYPFSSELLPFVKYFEKLQNDYSIDKLFSPPGFGLGGQDAAYACNHPPTGINIDDNFNAKDPEWSTLILVQANGENKVDDKHLVKVATISLQAGKEILYYGNCQGDVPQKILALKESFSDKISIFTGDMDFNSTSRTVEFSDAIETPCILIGGLVDEADVFEVLIALTACFKKRGWKTSAITKQPAGQCFGFHNLNFIYNENGLSEIWKIERLTDSLKFLGQAERPDVFLIEAPDVVMRYNDIISNGYGIQSYMLCQAIRPDIFISCMPYYLANGETLEELNKDLSIRLGSPIHAGHMSNLVLDSIDMLQTREVTYARTSLDVMHHQIKNVPQSSLIPIFDIVRDGAEKMFSIIENLL